MNTKLVHFDTTYNTNAKRNPYDHCTLKLSNPITKPKSINLKSVELPLILNKIATDIPSQTIGFDIVYSSGIPVYFIKDSEISIYITFKEGTQLYNIPINKGKTFATPAELCIDLTDSIQKFFHQESTLFQYNMSIHYNKEESNKVAVFF